MTMDVATVIQGLANYNAEQTVLGAILLEPELIKETKLQDKMFHADRKHRIIMNVMKAIDREGSIPDIVTIVSKMQEKDADLIHKAGGIGYLSDLAGSVPTTSNFRFYEKLVLDAHKLVLAFKYANSFIADVNQARDPLLISKLAKDIDELQDAETDSEFDMNAELMGLYEEYENPRKGLSGIDTGYRELNNLLDGWQGNDLIIVGARPSVGKTAFCINVGMNADDTWVDFFSLEMPKRQLLKRMISVQGHIDGQRMRTMNFQDQDHAKFTHAMGIVSGMHFHIHDKAGQTVEEIRSIARKNHRKATQMGLKHLVIIDYLQLIIYKGTLNDKNGQVGHISTSLKNLARDLEIPVIALSQLSRGVESRQDKRPMKSDLRDSGQIEQDADVIILMYRDDYYDSETESKNIIEIDIAKQRNGPLGKVELAFIKEYGKFVSLDRRYDQG